MHTFNNFIFISYLELNRSIKNGPKIDKFGVGNYNLFIWNNTGGFGRGYETHLPGRQPTKLADRALFGTADDNTTILKPYYSKSGLPWALEMPVSSFAYPVEKADITLAYRKYPARLNVL